MPFHDWLLMEMARANLTQGALARESGLHINTINAYVRGRQLPSMQNFRFICDALAWMQLLGNNCSADEKKMLSDQIMLEGIKTI